MNKRTTLIFTALIGATLVVAALPHLDRSRQALTQHPSGQQLQRLERELAGRLRLLEQLEDRLTATGLTAPQPTTVQTLLAGDAQRPRSPRQDNPRLTTTATPRADATTATPRPGEATSPSGGKPTPPAEIEPWWLDYEVGLIYAGPRNSHALINGRLYAPGDMVDAQVRVAAIAADALWLSRDGQRQRIPFRLEPTVLTRPVAAGNARLEP
ncbi:general secretion pathway protein GspB [Marichromatium bheemlicum]|uniref:General secretion pathway protein GspB n=1 Tax=Marichromatium bheemlicum TaxID=365339 RepID=A0ABX1I4P4_9GAMM|nr:general secretion pathway protein GspB [Marichromatium bheemlicum]NKN32387.1 general secretion pathway protein GspB [Marichromatium bheemlicum]